MSVIDTESLLQEVSPDEPCGPDLEYDPAFAEMERATQGKDEQQFGDTIIPAEEPNWKDVKKQALALLKRSKDLRTCAYLLRALIRTDGFPGLSDGLDLLERLVTDHWDTVHPQLDPDDDNDPTLRVNSIAMLCHEDTMIRSVRDAPLVSSRALGQFGLKDLQVVSGAVSAPAGTETPDPAAVDGAFMDCEVEELQAVENALANSMAKVESIEAVVTDHVGSANAVDLSKLVHDLKEAHKEMVGKLERRGVGVSGAEEEAEAGGDGAAATGAEGGAGRPITGEITTREDAIRMLDKVCDYFYRHEPSSPIPLLLKRAKRLVSKSFMEIMKDLAPDGVSQAQLFGGTEEDQ